MMITKSMLYAAGLKHGVNPYLVMGLAWHESGWQASVVSSAGAGGVMQVMPATAAGGGPALLHRQGEPLEPRGKIDMGGGVLKKKPHRDGTDTGQGLTAY